MIIYSYGSTHYSFRGVRSTSCHWVGKCSPPILQNQVRTPFSQDQPNEEHSNHTQFRLGDRIQVLSNMHSDGDGSFIRYFGGVLIWADVTGYIHFQVLGEGATVRKIG